MDAAPSDSPAPPARSAVTGRHPARLMLLAMIATLAASAAVTRAVVGARYRSRSLRPGGPRACGGTTCAPIRFWFDAISR